MVHDFVPAKPRRKRVRKPKAAEVVEIRPAVELCGVCHHLKYKAVTHINGSTYIDRVRCMNCPTCKGVRNAKLANTQT